MIPSEADVRDFRKAVYEVYRKLGRHDLPWRKTQNAYRVLLSEIMLQQTQVTRVRSRYVEFLEMFPTFEALAAAPLREVLAAWSGLGYNRRARFIHQLSQIVVDTYSGRLPESAEELRKLPGIGEYTASAVACFAFGKQEVFIETNIRRALIYSFFAAPPEAIDEYSAGDTESKKGESDPDMLVAERHNPHSLPRFPVFEHDFSPRFAPEPINDRDVKSVASEVLDYDNARMWNYALMDYGELIGRLVPNPNRQSSHYKKQSPFKGSKREVRGAIVRALSTVSQADEHTLAEQTGFSEDRITEALQALRREGIVGQADGSGMWKI